MNKDLKKLLRELCSKGWIIEKGRVHLKLRHPQSQKLVVVSGTPSCPHAYKNVKKMTDKIEEEINERNRTDSGIPSPY